MAEFNKCKTPFPYFGGKADAAPLVWQALGDVEHYVEPFFGGGAVLLRRPHLANRSYHSETVNDLDGLLVNAWRGIQMYPQETAEAASWPVSEFDKHARGCYLLKWRENEGAARLAGDPTFCDPLLAGWWMWCVCVQIGAWGQGGPWWPDADGKLVKRPRGWQKEVAADDEPGVPGDRTHLGNNGQGVHRPQLREPGVGVPGNLPFPGNNGRGVHHASTREPGVGVPGDLPFPGNNGRGVHHAGTREPGVGVPGDLPPITDDGRGVHRPQLREPGVGVPGDLPHLSRDGSGVNRPQLREPGLTWQQARDRDYEQTGGFHPVTMPKLREWFAYLSARLRHVRIVNGDWSRVVTKGAAETINVRQGKGVVGVFLDPPYGDVGRVSLYGKHEDFTVAEQVRAWCLERGDDPKYRIAYAGFDDEGAKLVAAGWREVEWFKGGHLKGGMGNTNRSGNKKHQQHRERLWFSPHCLGAEKPERTLFDEVA